MVTTGWAKQHDRFKMCVKVIPSSPRNLIIGFIQDELVIKLKTAPEKGKANKELVSFLSKELKISKKEIVILRGETSRHKLIELPLTAEKRLINSEKS